MLSKRGKLVIIQHNFIVEHCYVSLVLEFKLKSACILWQITATETMYFI